MTLRRSGLGRSSSLGGGGLRRNFKPINKYGRIAKERAERKSEWEADHPPFESNTGKKYYLCHICIYFGEKKQTAVVRYENYVLEHKVPKGRISLEESQKDSNLGPSHIYCNNEKGTRELWEMEKSPQTGKPNPYPTWPEYEEYLLWSIKN